MFQELAKVKWGFGLAWAIIAMGAYPLPGSAQERAEKQETSAKVRLDEHSNPVYSFQYPHDWRITQELEENGATLLVLGTLGESTVSLTCFPAELQMDLEQQTTKMARRWVARFREQEIRNVRIEEIERYGHIGRKMTSKIRGLVDWSEYTHEYFLLKDDHHSIFIHLSAPDSELNDGTQAAFNTMLKSLRFTP